MLDAQAPEQQRSLTSLVLLAAALAIVLAAMHVAAVVVSPFLLAMVLALIFWPLLVWLRTHGLGVVPALLVLVVGLVVGAALIALVIGSAISGMASRIGVYTQDLSERLQGLDAWFASYGLQDVNLASLLSPEAITSLFSALVGALASALSQGFVILLLLLFFLVEGHAIADRIRLSLDENDPNPARLARFGRDVGQYFALRAAVNAITGAGVALVLWLLGVDFPLLWGVLTFFLSFIPYIGMFLASVPSVLLAWAEFDLAHAVVVGVALTIVNATAENLVQPALMHKGLNLSPTFVFVSVFFWGWLLPGGGSFLAIPISLGLLAILANFPATRWFTDAVTTSSAHVQTPESERAAVPGEPTG
jgi:predicted PurR-regulated permease PerM